LNITRFIIYPFKSIFILGKLIGPFVLGAYLCFTTF
jgi:hypothetical protein